MEAFAPGISHGVSSEILAFEAATIGSLEQHVKEVIVGIFHGDSTQFQSSQNINEFKAARVGANQAGPDGPNLPQYQYPSTDIVVSRDGTNAQGATADLPAYGTRGLPFAGGTSAAAASTPPPDPAEPERQKSIFQSALSSVSHFAKEATDTVQDGVENEVKSMANKIDELAGDIDQKVEQIIPDLKAKVEEVFQELDKGLADLMTTAALACVKTFLAGAIKVEELGEDVLKGAESLMGGILGHNDAPQTTPGEPHGPVALLSNKLGGGLTVIRGNARVDFRGFLSKIEEDLFNGLPDRLKEPLSKIFGNSSSTTGGGTGILAEIGQKIEQILERIGQALRDRVSSVSRSHYCSWLMSTVSVRSWK